MANKHDYVECSRNTYALGFKGNRADVSTLHFTSVAPIRVTWRRTRNLKLPGKLPAQGSSVILFFAGKWKLASTVQLFLRWRSLSSRTQNQHQNCDLFDFGLQNWSIYFSFSGKYFIDQFRRLCAMYMYLLALHKKTSNKKKHFVVLKKIVHRSWIQISLFHSNSASKGSTAALAPSAFKTMLLEKVQVDLLFCAAYTCLHLKEARESLAFAAALVWSRGRGNPFFPTASPNIPFRKLLLLFPPTWLGCSHHWLGSWFGGWEAWGGCSTWRDFS